MDFSVFFFFQAEDGIRDLYVTGVQTCALPIFPDGARRQQTAVCRHAVRLAVIDRLEDLAIGAAVAPATVAQAGAHPARRPATVTTVAVHHAERPLALHRRLPVSAERILAGLRGARRRRDAARENARLVSGPGRGLTSPACRADAQSQY